MPTAADYLQLIIENATALAQQPPEVLAEWVNAIEGMAFDLSYFHERAAEVAELSARLELSAV